MKHTKNAFWMSAVLCGILMNGCGTEHTADHGAQAHQVTTAKAASSESDSDRENSLYEEDDVHRKTDREEPDLIDRAESAVTEIVSDAEEKLDDMKKHK